MAPQGRYARRGGRSAKSLKRLRRQSVGRTTDSAGNTAAGRGAAGYWCDQPKIPGRQTAQITTGCSSGSETRLRQVSGAFWPGTCRKHRVMTEAGSRAWEVCGYAMAWMPGAVRNSQCETHGAQYSRTLRNLLHREMSPNVIGCKGKASGKRRGRRLIVGGPCLYSRPRASRPYGADDQRPADPSFGKDGLPLFSGIAVIGRHCQISSDCPGGPDGRPRHGRNPRETCLAKQ